MKNYGSPFLKAVEAFQAHVGATPPCGRTVLRREAPVRRSVDKRIGLLRPRVCIMKNGTAVAARMSRSPRGATILYSTGLTVELASAPFFVRH